MEASNAGLAAAGDAGQDAGADAGVDLSQITETLTSLSQGQEDLRDFLQSAPWQAEAELAEPEAPEVPDLSFLDDPDLPPDDLAERLTGAFDARSQQMVQQALAPLQEKIAEQERLAQAQQLVAEFPDLADAETASTVVKAASEWAQQIGKPEMANDPAVWRLVYMASRAADAANNESSGSPAAHLEGSGGPSAAGGQQVDLADRIINAAGPRRVLPF